jgi:hypothetical protein
MADFPRKRAIIVGVDRYTDITPLSFCGDDAREVASSFRKSLQFKKEDIFEFTTTSAVKPERSKILGELGRLKSEGVGEDELLIFYFSGHGMIDTKNNKDYLLPVDAAKFNLSLTGIRVEDVVSDLKETGCKNIVMFIDACREVVDGSKGVYSIGDDSKAAAGRAGIVSFFSCDPKEKSYEIQALGHGSFTYCILDAIAKGECNTVAEINQFLRKEVPLVNRKHDKPAQLPYAIVEPADKADLAIFFSESRRQRVDTKYDDLADIMADKYADGTLDDVWLNTSILLIEHAKSHELTEIEARKFKLIESLARGNMGAVSFPLAWKALERRTLGAPAAPDALGRLK